MSWEAVAWANQQKMKKSYEQIILLVLANCADKDGEAFVKWPFKDHWWSYLSEKTRLPRSSLFRHLNTIVALGLGSKTMLVLADGTKRPTFKLNMEATFDIETEEDERRYEALVLKVSDNESPVETHDDDVTNHAEFSNETNATEAASSGNPSESPVETGAAIPSVGNEPFPVLGTHKDSKLDSNLSPQPPSGGQARDELWDQFVSAWRDGIPKFALAQAAWGRIATHKRPKAIAAARGYWAWLKSLSKPREPVSAQAFLKDDGGWEQWLRYVPNGEISQSAITGGYPIESLEGKAICRLYEIAGLNHFLRTMMIKNGMVWYRNPITPRLLRLGQDDFPKREQWQPASYRSAGSWEEFLRDAVTANRPRRLVEGDPIPWPFAPSKEGKIYPTAGPPTGEGMMTEDDYQHV